MKIWKNAFSLWKNFCPYYRRRLLTREELLSWAAKSKFIRDYGSEKDEFSFFINLLLEIEALCPILENGATIDSRYYHEPRRIHLGIRIQPETFELYHPIQFFEIMNWYFRYKHYSWAYMQNDNYGEYYKLRSLELKINKKKREIQQWDLQDLDNSYNQKVLADYQEEYSAIHKEFPKGEELRKLLKIPSSLYPITEKQLEVWIKIETLITPIGTDILAPMNISLIATKVLNSSNANDFYKAYKIWVENIFNEHGKHVNQEEIREIETWSDILYRIVSDDKSPISSNWLDLIELAHPHLQQKFTGTVSHFLNLRSIRRNLIRFYWKLTGKNLQFLGHPPRNPHFFFENSDEYVLYLRSVLLFFGLNPSHNFILYVAGGTEQTILKEYVDRRWIKFLIRNMRSEDKSRFFKKVCEDIGGRDFFFLFDFHDLRQYEKKRAKYGDNCEFFFPDFVTENFTTNQVFDAFMYATQKLKIRVSKEEGKIVLDKLTEEKDKSNQILEELARNSSKSFSSAKGFEKIIIEHLRNSYSLQIVQIFPEIRLDENGRISHKTQREKLSVKIKTLLAKHLKTYVINSLEGDPERKGAKFPFEVKLEPFIDKILEVINVAGYWSSN